MPSICTLFLLDLAGPIMLCLTSAQSAHGRQARVLQSCITVLNGETLLSIAPVESERWQIITLGRLLREEEEEGKKFKQKLARTKVPPLSRLGLAAGKKVMIPHKLL